MTGLATTFAAWDHDMGTGAWLFMGLGMVAFWALVAAVIVWLVRESSGRRDQAPDPRRLLDERLARGEIDLEQYRELRRALDASPGQPTGASA